MKSDLEDYRVLLKTAFIGSLPNWKILQLYPSSSISNIYGTIKLHKKGEPVRIMVPSYDSMVANAEKYLKKSVRDPKS